MGCVRIDNVLQEISCEITKDPVRLRGCMFQNCGLASSGSVSTWGKAGWIIWSLLFLTPQQIHPASEDADCCASYCYLSLPSDCWISYYYLKYASKEVAIILSQVMWCHLSISMAEHWWKQYLCVEASEAVRKGVPFTCDHSESKIKCNCTAPNKRR